MAATPDTGTGSYPHPIHPSRTHIGWIGTGVMGAAMASRLLSAGYSLSIYARTPSKASALLSSGASFASSPAALASQSHIIFSMVGHPHDVRSVLLDPASGALSALSPGSVLVDCTSSHPALAREVALAAKDKNCFAVDAPVSGGDVGARDGTLAILAGGDKEVVEWLSPLFDLLGKVTWMGPPGSGQISKIGNQIAVAGSVLGTTEGILFARKAGLDAAAFLEAIGSGAAGSKVMEIFGGRILKRDFLPGGYVEYMVKDLGMALETPDDGNSDSDGAVVLAGAALFRQMFTGMVANGDGKMGMQGLITVHERMNGNGNGNGNGIQCQMRKRNNYIHITNLSSLLTAQWHNAHALDRRDATDRDHASSSDEHEDEDEDEGSLEQGFMELTE